MIIGDYRILYVKINGEYIPFGCLTSNSFDENLEILPTSTRENAGWRTSRPAFQSFNVNFDAFYERTNALSSIISYNEVVKLKRSKTKLDFKIEINLNGIIETETFEGYITTLSETSQTGEIISYSANILGYSKPLNTISYFIEPETIDDFFTDKNFPTQGNLNTVVAYQNDEFLVTKHLGRNDWLEYTLINIGDLPTLETTPYKLAKKRCFKLYGYLTIAESVKVGAWVDTNSNDPSPYIAHVASRTFTANDTITWTATYKGTITLFYVASTDSGIFEVIVDGGTPILVDSYNPVANTWKQSVVIGVDLPLQEHTIVIRSTGDKNPSSSNDRVWINAVQVQDETATPINNPLGKEIGWEMGVAVSQYDERIGANQNVYVAQNSGTTGATQPSHTSGTVSDGSINWLWTAATSFVTTENTLQPFGSSTLRTSASEWEYAMNINYNGLGLQDLGGNIHGNEYLNANPLIIIDGVEEAYTDGFIGSGSIVEIKQSITGFYQIDPSTKLNVLDTEQRHIFTKPKMQVKVSFRLLQELSFGFFYSAMLPLVAYHGATARIQYERMYSREADFNLIDYESDPSDPILGNKENYVICNKGRLYNIEGYGGVPVVDDKPLATIYSALRTTDASVDGFVNSDIKCGLAVNRNDGENTGFSSWAIKNYMTRYELSYGVSLIAGSSINIEGNYFNFIIYN